MEERAIAKKLPDDLAYVVDPEVLAPELAEVRDYWRAKCGARAMPRRADINPAELRQHLPYLSLIEVLPDTKDYRFRLLGTAFSEILGRNSTGKTIREVYASADPDVMQWMLDSYDAVVKHKRPVFKRGTLRAVQKEFIAAEAVHMPLSEDGEHVNMLFGRTRFIAGKTEVKPDKE